MRLIDADALINDIEELITEHEEMMRDGEEHPKDYPEDYKTRVINLIAVKHGKWIPEACKNCSNHPSNGGSGICFCTLGGVQMRW